MLTLSVAEIKDLAEYAGFVLNQRFMPSSDAMAERVVISASAKEGVSEGGEPRAHFAAFADYPDKGICHLGAAPQG